MRWTGIIVAAAALVACGGKGGNDSTVTGSGAPGTGGTGTGTGTGGTTSAGWTLSATVIDFGTQQPAAEGLCVEALDPSPALTGGDPALVASATVGAAGAVEIAGITVRPSLGMLISVKDCGAENTTVFTSANGLAYAKFRDLGEGAVLSGETLYAIDLPYLATLQADAEAVGYTGDLLTDGMMFPMVADNTGAPVAGATVTCDACAPTLYIDGNGGDGLFAEAGVPNAATTVEGHGAGVIPAGPVAQYITEDGGAHTWEVMLFGSSPGSALVAPIWAN